MELTLVPGSGAVRVLERREKLVPHYHLIATGQFLREGTRQQ